MRIFRCRERSWLRRSRPEGVAEDGGTAILAWRRSKSSLSARASKKILTRLSISGVPTKRHYPAIQTFPFRTGVTRIFLILGSLPEILVDEARGSIILPAIRKAAEGVPPAQTMGSILTFPFTRSAGHTENKRIFLYPNSLGP